MSKDFTIDDLRYGYLVELRDGRYALYMPSQNGNVFDFGDTYFSVGNYQNDLKYYSNCTNCFDIVRIYGWTDSASSIQLTTDHRELIWERNERETVKMTVDEMKEKLEELLDKNVEVKNSITMKLGILSDYCRSKSRQYCHSCIFKDAECDFCNMSDSEIHICYEKYLNEKEGNGLCDTQNTMQE